MSEMREMTDKELDGVCGGYASDSFNYIRQTQKAYQAAAVFGGQSVWGNVGDTTNTQSITQSQSVSL
jgi:hypothetical protein